jgi:phosphohistidine phosphatase
MGVRICEEELSPGLIVSSTAARARQTAELVGETCGYTGSIALAPGLYFGSPGAYLEATHDVPSEVETLLVVGHNPGIQELVWMLSGREERMPTAALATIEFDIDSWQNLGTEAGELISVWRPKEIF